MAALPTPSSAAQHTLALFARQDRALGILVPSPGDTHEPSMPVAQKALVDLDAFQLVLVEVVVVAGGARGRTRDSWSHEGLVVA